jgi:hypothetical protein
MPPLLKKSHLGTALMIISPVITIGFGSEVFFPVAVTSVLGGVICLIFKSLTTHMVVGQITAELLNELISADADRRELVLSELDLVERKWFVIEIARIEAGLVSGWRTSRPEQPKVSTGNAIIGNELDIRCACHVGGVCRLVQT